MDKIFAEMFAKQPDEITGGDYFYHIPWYEDLLLSESINFSTGMSITDLRKERENS